MGRPSGVLYIGGIAHEVDGDALRRAVGAWILAGTAAAPMADLARKAGVSRCTVWRFLNGKRVGLSSAQRICQVIGLEISDLLRPAAMPGRAETLVHARALARRLTELLEALERPEQQLK